MFHLYLISSNTTTHEYFSKYWKLPKHNPYNLGIQRNWKFACFPQFNSASDDDNEYEEIGINSLRIFPENSDVKEETPKDKDQDEKQEIKINHEDEESTEDHCNNLLRSI